MSEDPRQYGEPHQESTPIELAKELVWIARGLGKVEADVLCAASVYIRKNEAANAELRLRLENASDETLAAMPDWSDSSIDAAIRKEEE